MSKREFDRFGRYLILDHYVDGGMAKISRARYLGEEADKIVVIKMVQPQYSADPSFKQMFMDEIKVTFSLIHPNIVQTYDYGYQNNQLYVAMEYCDGRNLKEYLDKLKERKFVFPVEISVYIITQVCQGLHYAHTLTDKLTGKQYNIIHRDISPHNIMMTFDGAVKVIDFGIAKADTNSEATQAGTIKGKLSYLAPEYLDGKQLDTRYDQFAVGITLWEMLCSRKLFKAANDLAVLKKIQECKVPPPSSVNPNVPKELDQIVLKSLHKDREKRYENMDQLNRALIKFLYTTYPDFNASDLAYFAKELFKEEIKKDREKLFEYGKIDLAPYIADMKNEGSGGAAASPDSGAESSKEAAPAASSSKAAARGENILDFGFDDDGEEEEKRTKSGTRVVDTKSLMKKSKTRKINVGKSGAAKDVGAKDGTLTLGTAAPRRKVSRSKMGGSDSTKTGISRASITNTKSKSKTKTRTNVKSVDIKKKGANKALFAAVGVAALAGVMYFKSPDLINKFIKKDRGPSSIDGSENTGKNAGSDGQNGGENVQPVEEEFGTVILNGYDKYKQKAYVNGFPIEISILGEAKVKYGSNIVLRVQSSGVQHFVTKFDLSEGNPTAKIKIPKMPFASYGYLITPRNCVTGKLIFNLFGEDRVERLPIKGKRGIAFPLNINKEGEVLPTDYEIYYQKDHEDFQRKAHFTIKYENDSIDFCNTIFKNTN